MTRVVALVATIPSRRASCERLLGELARQSRPPDLVMLCPDGYEGNERVALTENGGAAFKGPVMVFPSVRCGGPGQKWRVLRDCDPDEILISIDDDAELSASPDFLRTLLDAMEQGKGAAAAMGYTPDGHRAAPGNVSRGRLLLACGCGLALRAGQLEGLQQLAEEVKAAGGPDALGPCGDDQALVSAHLWRKGIPILHAATGPLSFAPGTQAGSQTRARQARGEATLFEQARQIAQITGWPLAEPVVEVEDQPPLSWEAELSAVPAGAVRARGAAPAAGFRRVLVVDGEEPERSGVYDVPTKEEEAP